MSWFWRCNLVSDDGARTSNTHQGKPRNRVKGLRDIPSTRQYGHSASCGVGQGKRGAAPPILVTLQNTLG